VRRNGRREMQGNPWKNINKSVLRGASSGKGRNKKKKVLQSIENGKGRKESKITKKFGGEAGKQT